MPLALLPCIMVMEIISRNIITKDVLRKMMYADDLIADKQTRSDSEVLEESDRGCSRSMD